MQNLIESLDEFAQVQRDLFRTKTVQNSLVRMTLMPESTPGKRSMPDDLQLLSSKFNGKSSHLKIDSRPGIFRSLECERDLGTFF